MTNPSLPWNLLARNYVQIPSIFKQFKAYKFYYLQRNIPLNLLREYVTRRYYADIATGQNLKPCRQDMVYMHMIEKYMEIYQKYA